MFEPRRRHLGADGGAHRKKERQPCERVEVLGPPGLGKTAVEDDVGRGFEIALDQIHEQEGEIVEHVTGCDQRTELDGVECDRPAAEEHDGAVLKVAVQTPNQPAMAALDDERTDAGVGGAALRRQ